MPPKADYLFGAILTVIPKVIFIPAVLTPFVPFTVRRANLRRQKRSPKAGHPKEGRTPNRYN
jgi:hypothetical protein